MNARKQARRRASYLRAKACSLYESGAPALAVQYKERADRLDAVVTTADELVRTALRRYGARP